MSKFAILSCKNNIYIYIWNNTKNLFKTVRVVVFWKFSTRRFFRKTTHEIFDHAISPIFLFCFFAVWKEASVATGFYTIKIREVSERQVSNVTFLSANRLVPSDRSRTLYRKSSGFRLDCSSSRDNCSWTSIKTRR